MAWPIAYLHLVLDCQIKEIDLKQDDLINVHLQTLTLLFQKKFLTSYTNG